MGGGGVVNGDKVGGRVHPRQRRGRVECLCLWWDTKTRAVGARFRDSCIFPISYVSYTFGATSMVTVASCPTGQSSLYVVRPNTFTEAVAPGA